MKEIWITKNGKSFPIKVKSTSEYMNNLIRNKSKTKLQKKEFSEAEKKKQEVIEKYGDTYLDKRDITNIVKRLTGLSAVREESTYVRGHHWEYGDFKVEDDYLWNEKTHKVDDWYKLSFYRQREDISSQLKAREQLPIEISPELFNELGHETKRGRIEKTGITYTLGNNEILINPRTKK